MTQINKITSFKTFSEIQTSNRVAKLAEENATKRSGLTAKIAELLDEMEINSFEDLAEDAKKQFISKVFGNASEEVEVEVSDEIKDAESNEDEESTSEGNAFGDAVRKAKEAGKDEFEFDGETYKVEESQVNEAKFNKNSLMKAVKGDDGIIKLANGDEFIIYNPDNGNDDNAKMWGDKSILALDQDGEEHEIKYSDIVSYNESLVTEAKFKKGQYIKSKNDSDDFDGDVYDRTNDIDGAEILKNSSFEIHKIGKYEVILWSDEDEVEYSIDPDDLKNFVKESLVTEAKELFQLDIDSEEHGALGLSVTMKELKDVYKKNKKSISDVEGLLFKFVYDQPEDFDTMDTEGMQISGADSTEVYAMLAKEFGIKENNEYNDNGVKFVKEYNSSVLDVTTKKEALNVYPNAKFFVGKSDHFFGELDNNLFFKAYYTGDNGAFEIKSVYSKKGSKYVHLFNESYVNESKIKVTKKDIEDIEDSGNIDIAYKKAMALLTSLVESYVNEAEIKSDEEFKEYAFTVLKKAFGDDFDEDKATKIVDGILSKSDGDYGKAAGILTSSLG